MRFCLHASLILRRSGYLGFQHGATDGIIDDGPTAAFVPSTPRARETSLFLRDQAQEVRTCSFCCCRVIVISLGEHPLFYAECPRSASCQHAYACRRYTCDLRRIQQCCLRRPTSAYLQAKESDAAYLFQTTTPTFAAHCASMTDFCRSNCCFAVCACSHATNLQS